MRILVLSKIFPSNVFPVFGPWIKNLTTAYAKRANVSVVSPVPYCPPLPSAFDYYTRYREIPTVHQVDNYSVHRPRYPVLPRELLPGTEGSLYRLFTEKKVHDLHQQEPFDLIHAHYGYPDGVVASKIGRDLGIPVVVTDHAYWSVWINKSQSVRRQAMRASNTWDAHVCVSSAHREDALHYTGRHDSTHVIHLGYDDSIFHPGEVEHQIAPPRVLYVGYINYTKGVDILLQAMRQLVQELPDLRLTLVGGGFDETKMKQEAELKSLARELDLGENVEFAGIQPPETVAEYMRASTMLVSASRRETLGVVMIESLATGLPVVATRSGGSEDIVTPDVGVLVNADDPEALAAGIQSMLDNRSQFDRTHLHATASNRFSLSRIADEYLSLFAQLK